MSTLFYYYVHDAAIMLVINLWYGYLRLFQLCNNLG